MIQQKQKYVKKNKVVLPFLFSGNSSMLNSFNFFVTKAILIIAFEYLSQSSKIEPVNLYSAILISKSIWI